LSGAREETALQIQDTSSERWRGIAGNLNELYRFSIKSHVVQRSRDLLHALLCEDRPVNRSTVAREATRSKHSVSPFLQSLQ
jgi:hypothetical protein